ncbi:wd repeat protein [Stylonychia lemnae]|uniref:Wd repeat protein n=1 Tax=Stylonychia lemnae TaxID=5949 RepID=A0A078A7U8_STYLE|nr:wd repeat protein [Stylonychia lemnae]|eukprot:CDW77642.1 wd repeat protein [Stylonychia lemnae]
MMRTWKFNKMRGKIMKNKSSMKSIKKRKQQFDIDFEGRDERNFYQHILPNSLATTYEEDITARIYGGRFTKKGNLYYASSQEELILYDTTDPNKWQLKTIYSPNNISWTILDMDVDKNEQFLRQETLRVVTDEEDNNRRRFFGMMSVKFSPCGKQTLSSSNRCQLLLYDLESNRTIKKVEKAHQEDINSVCFSHHYNPNIFYSASDDCVLKVWDQRTLQDGKSCVGKFVGHSQGITCVAGRNDGNYLASNGKDQLLKLWDLRYMITPNNFLKVRPFKRNTAFDYRMHDFYLPNPLDQKRHPDDKSVMTFSGHEVLRTLIKCQFSPEQTTGQRYIISGGSNGEVHIFDILSGETATVLNDEQYDQEYFDEEDMCSRDVSWHPEVPLIAQTSFQCQIKVWNYESDEIKIKEVKSEDQSMKQSRVMTRSMLKQRNNKQ